MRAKFILMALTLFYMKSIFAQQEKIPLNLPEAVKIAAVESKPVKEGLNGKAFRVINLTGDSLILGYLPSLEKGNERIALTAPIDKQEYIEASVGGNLDLFFTNRGTQGILVLHDISVGPINSGTFVRVNGVLYESPISGNSYRQIKSIDEVFNDNTADVKNATGLIGSSIVAAITSSASETMAKEAFKGKSLEEVLKAEKDKFTFISKGVFPTGIYLSYEEFKSGKPSFDHFYLKTDTMSNTVEINAFTVSDSTLKPVQGVWAIAAANELYIYQGGMLRAVESFGNNLVFSKYLDPEIRTNNGVFWRGTIGNRFNEWNAQNPFDNRYVLSLTNYRSKGFAGEATKVNGETGAPEL